MVVFCIALMTIAILLSKNIYHKFINPITIFCGVNLFSIILMFGTSIIDSRVSDVVWLYVFIMIISYIVGAYWGSYKFVFGRNKTHSTLRITNTHRLNTMIIIYSIVFDVFAFMYLIHLVRDYGLQKMFLNMSGLNAAVQSGEFASGIYIFFTPIGFSLSLMILYSIKKSSVWGIKKFLLIIQYVLCYIPCISPRRDTLFFMIIITVLYFITQNIDTIEISKKTSKKIKRGILIFSGIVFGVWLMSFTQELMGKSISNTIDFKIFGFKAIDYLKDPVVYIAGNYANLEKMYQYEKLNASTPLISTLRLIYRYIGPLIGVNIDTTTDFTLQFNNIGNRTTLLFNTVPILYYIIKDAGVFFFVVFIFIGFLSRKAFDAVQNKKSIGSIMLGLFQYCVLILSFRSYLLTYLTYLLTLIYMFIAHIYIDNEFEEKKL